MYEEGLINYSYDGVGDLFLAAAKKGIPCIFDNKLMERRALVSQKSSVWDTDIYQICEFVPQLKPGFRSGLYNRCLIPCKKRENTIKVDEFNDYFAFCFDTINPVLHPDTEEPGCQLYITSNCKLAIELFKNWTFDVKNGMRVRKKTREDAWDSISYGIDTYNYDREKRKLIDSIWNDKRYKLQTLASQTRRPMYAGVTINNYINM